MNSFVIPVYEIYTSKTNNNWVLISYFALHIEIVHCHYFNVDVKRPNDTNRRLY